MINQIRQYILVRRGSSFLSNGEEVRRPNEGWIFWGKVYMYFYSRYKCVLTNRVNRYIIYTNVLGFFLLCFITSIRVFISNFKEGRMSGQHQKSPVEFSMHTRQDIAFNLLFRYSHYHLL